MKPAILYRFHKDVEPHKQRLRIIRHFHPGVPVHGLYGGQNFAEAEIHIAPLLDSIWCYPGDDANFKWMHAEHMIKLWFANLGHRYPFDVLYDHEWDLLFAAPLTEVYPPLNENLVGITGRMLMANMVNVWGWTADPKRRPAYQRFCHYMSDRYGIGLQKYMGLWPGTAMGRKFIESFAEEPYPLEIIKDIHCEAVLSCFAEALGFEIVNTGLHPANSPHVPGHLTGPHFHCHASYPVDVRTMFVSMNRPKGKRHFAFHPAPAVITLEQLLALKAGKPPPTPQPVTPAAAAPAVPAAQVGGSGNPLETVPQVTGGLWLVKKEGRFSCRDDGGIETRNASVIKLLEMAHNRYPDLPDFGPVYLCTQDQPEGRAPGQIILAFSTDRRRPKGSNGQDVRAVPDNVFDHWRNAGMPDYEQVCADMRAAGSKPPQKNVAGWIGNAGMHPIRGRLVALAQSIPEHLEAINTGQWKAVPGMPRFEVGQGRYVSMPELVSTYAYLLDIEGNGWSGRLKLLFHSGRPLLLQERPWQEFYFDLIKPMEHYVPIATDLSDLKDRIVWLKENPHEGERIARNAQELAQKYLTRDAAIDAWARTLRALASPSA